MFSHNIFFSYSIQYELSENRYADQQCFVGKIEAIIVHAFFLLPVWQHRAGKKRHKTLFPGAGKVLERPLQEKEAAGRDLHPAPGRMKDLNGTLDADNAKNS